MNKIAVIYLSYVPYGANFLRNFLNSYQKNKSGISHELIIAFNGYNDYKDVDPFIDILNEFSIEFKIEKTKSRYDIDVYYFLANKLSEYKYFLFFNTYSEILNNNWLLFYYDILKEKNVGCVSATGAWGDQNHLLDYKNAIKRILKFNFNILDLKKVIYFKYNFYPKVSFHLRTNAFMIERFLFLSIERPNVKPFVLRLLLGLNKKKLRSFCFEHGSRSFSQQLINKGYKIKIVNKYGKGFDINEWANSNVFWNGEQENLLIQDNQTFKYSSSSIEVQKKLIFSAWGHI